MKKNNQQVIICISTLNLHLATYVYMCEMHACQVVSPSNNGRGSPRLKWCHSHVTERVHLHYNWVFRPVYLKELLLWLHTIPHAIFTQVIMLTLFSISFPKPAVPVNFAYWAFLA